MKTFPSYDYTLCDNEKCPKKKSCMRYLTYRKAKEEKYPYPFPILILKENCKCEMYVKAE